jgi:hypothetical protein
MSRHRSWMGVLAIMLAFAALSAPGAGAAAPKLAAPTFIESVHAVKLVSGRHAGRVGVDVGVRWGDFSKAAARGVGRHRATLTVQRLGTGGRVLAGTHDVVSLPLTETGRHIPRLHFIALPGPAGQAGIATLRISARQTVVSAEGPRTAVRGVDRVVATQSLAGDAYVEFPLTSCQQGYTIASFYCGLSFGPAIPFQASAGASVFVGCPNYDFGQSAFTYGPGMPATDALAGLVDGTNLEGHWGTTFPNGDTLVAATTTVKGPGAVNALTCWRT